MVDWDNDPLSMSAGFAWRDAEFKNWPVGPFIKATEDQLIEKFAIRCAKGNNGGEWEMHYTEDQKNYWRQFMRDLVAALRQPSAAA